MTTLTLRPLLPHPADVDALAVLLVETVAGGGSVGFMDPLAPDEAAAFWRAALEAAARGGRVVLGAFTRDERAQDELVGTVSLLLDLPPNQPHRAEIAKMMTRPSHRGRGVATALLREAERLAAARGRTLLVLDTAVDGGASGLYEKLGYVRAGEIPDFALKPQGGLTGTRLYWKRLPA
ncbi:GNAT family N-acetyltransferase [Starkeya sp. 3C]|uniref:GNAT family N-acetyltransferase n=1 Tax=Ancylobacter moscoviensis TaxID=2597768 RepID=A0ABY3DRR7_9HYPH|nr:GNAT family N-acetyltransferase [Ancylobacter moscoviensis]TSJ62738.1 GNAT family N-acetyltransferase [Ancylobacter moscoviensis]